MKNLDCHLKSNIDYQEFINQSEFIFLGFIIMEQSKSEENIEAIRALNGSKVNLIYLSQQR